MSTLKFSSESQKRNFEPFIIALIKEADEVVIIFKVPRTAGVLDFKEQNCVFLKEKLLLMTLK